MRQTTAITAGLLIASSPLVAAADPFPGADLANGRRIHYESKCASCHTEKTGRDEGFIYLRDERKVKTIFELKRYVSLCNSELRLELFPEDERDVAAFVNQQWYRLKE
jgi:mono/diheme cytochrome c family protein